MLGAAWREAAARNLHAEPVFSYFHPPSSSFRVMLKLVKPKRPPASAYANLAHVARCGATGELWRVPSDRLDRLVEDAAERTDGPSGGRGGRGGHKRSELRVMGPMWVGGMHDGDFVRRMATAAREREWADATALLETMAAEAAAEEQGALLFYHLGEVQRALAKRALPLPSSAALIEALRAAGYGASGSHSEKKALKTSATLKQVVAVVASMEGGGSA